MRTLLLFALFLLTVIVNAQVGIGTSTPNGALDIASSTNGILVPRVALTFKNLAAPVVNPNGGALTAGTLVWNTATSGILPNNVVPGFYYWDGGVWVALSGSGGKNWSVTGNGGTLAANNFIGTTDDNDIIFKRNNIRVGMVGSGNISLGSNALNPSGTGAENVALGGSALYSNTAGNGNAAIGSLSLYTNTIGIKNTANGYRALYSNTEGWENTGIGEDALYGNTIGAYNTAVGGKSLGMNLGGSNNTALGYFSLVSNIAGVNNTAVGWNSMGNNTSGANNTGCGYLALALNSTGSNNTAIGYNAQVPNETANNQVRIGDTNITYAGIQVGWTTTSDRRLKSEIKKSDLGLGFIKKLNPVSYIRLNDSAKKTEYGFIAQEAEETLKGLGVTNTGMISKDDKGMYSIRYNDLFAPMVRALQEQQEVIEDVKAKNRQMEEVNSQMKETIDQMKETIKQQQEINKQQEIRLKTIENKLK